METASNSMEKSKHGKQVSCLKRFHNFLSPRSTAFYVVPGVPSILAFITGLAMSIFYTTCESDYNDHCPDRSGDRLREFIAGSIICWLILPVGYANLVFNSVKYLRSLIGAFVFFALYLIGTLVFHILGIAWISDSKCKDETYYGTIAIATLIIFFAVWALLLVSMGFVFIKECCRKAERIEPQGVGSTEPAIEKNERELDRHEKIEDI